MTLRLDLRTVQSAGLPPSTLINPEPFGCADCGRWFAFATGPDGLVAHLREHARPADE